VSQKFTVHTDLPTLEYRTYLKAQNAGNGIWHLRLLISKIFPGEHTPHTLFPLRSAFGVPFGQSMMFLLQIYMELTGLNSIKLSSIMHLSMLSLRAVRGGGSGISGAFDF
jgi:hypothetical protein